MDWKQWFAGQVANSGMEVAQVPLRNIAPDWGMLPDGDFGRPDGKFFTYVGVRVTMKKDQREVSSWVQPMICEYGEGAVVVIKARGEEKFLLQAKPEPGNDYKNGQLMLNAPLSASVSNLQAAHGGKRPPRAELLDQGTKLMVIPQDGGKYLRKKNHYGWVEADPAAIVPNANERWFTLEEIREAMQEGLVSEHLCQALLTSLLKL